MCSPSRTSPQTHPILWPPWGPGPLCFLSGFARFCQDRDFVPRRHSPAHGISAFKATQETWAPETGPPKRSRSVSTQHPCLQPTDPTSHPLHPLPMPSPLCSSKASPSPLPHGIPPPRPSKTSGSIDRETRRLCSSPCLGSQGVPLSWSEASALGGSTWLPSACSGGLLPASTPAPHVSFPQLWFLPPSFWAACLLSQAPQSEHPTEVPPPRSHLTPT